MFKLATMHEEYDARYTIDPPDEILLKCPGIKELDGERETVKPDGNVHFKLVGDVKVQALHPHQVQLAIKNAASRWYKNPDIKVEITAASKFFHIVGKGVNHPGKVVFTGNDSILNVISEIGQIERAWPTQILLTRPGSPDHLAAVAVIDFENMIESGRMSQNYLVNANDVIDVRDRDLPELKTGSMVVCGALWRAGPTTL